MIYFREPNNGLKCNYITMPASPSGSAAEDTERGPLLAPITSESYAGPVEVTNNQYRARNVHVSYPLLKFSIAWLGMRSKDRIHAFVSSFSDGPYKSQLLSQ